jgi:hypothetical protein
MRNKNTPILPPVTKTAGFWPPFHSKRRAATIKNGTIIIFIITVG